MDEIEEIILRIDNEVNDKLSKLDTYFSILVDCGPCSKDGRDLAISHALRRANSPEEAKEYYLNYVKELIDNHIGYLNGELINAIAFKGEFCNIVGKINGK